MGQYNYSKLLGRIKELELTQVDFAKKIGISATSANLTLNNKRDFRQEEITKACAVLRIEASEIPDYFFAH